MHKVGEAAGVAAAMSIRTGSAPRELDRSGLQKRLVERSVLEGRSCSGPMAGIFASSAVGWQV